ncbi:hypothetical protein BYT27DRAFT_6820173 [Phlegmacium glaucopus]|nr:hypothetical protein BYT27DRAFT_6820173 [Phlegmacium glaucopus]
MVILTRNCHQNKNTHSQLSTKTRLSCLFTARNPHNARVRYLILLRVSADKRCLILGGPHRSILDTRDPRPFCFLRENRDPFLKSLTIPRAAIPNQTR